MLRSPRIYANLYLHLSHIYKAIGFRLSLGIMILCFLSSQVFSHPQTEPHNHSVLLSQEKVDDLLKKGNTLHNQAQYKKAKEAFLAILKAFPSHKAALQGLALAAYHLKDHHLAHRAFNSLAEKKQLSRKHAFEAGYSAYKMRDHKRCYELMSTVAVGGSTYDIASYYAGVCTYEMEKWQESLRFLKRAVILPVSLVASKKRLIAELEMIIARKTQGAAKQLTPTRVPRGTPMFISLEPPRPHVLFYAAHWNLDPTFEPAQTGNLSDYTTGKIQLDYPWIFDQNLDTAKETYHLGVGLKLGANAAVEHLREATLPHSTDLQSLFVESVIASEGRRHDNYIFYGKIQPWAEWGFDPKGKLGVYGSYGGYYGNFEKDDQNYISKLQLTPFLTYALSDNILSHVTLQADYWIGLSYGNAGKYAASLQILSKIQRSYELDASVASALHLTKKRSYTPLTTHSGLIIFRYHTPFWISLEIGGDVEYLGSYQIWPKNAEDPLRANGWRLGLLGGIKATPFKEFQATLRYTTSDISWSSASEDPLSDDWKTVAPIAQGTLLGIINYRLHFDG